MPSTTWPKGANRLRIVAGGVIAEVDVDLVDRGVGPVLEKAT